MIDSGEHGADFGSHLNTDLKASPPHSPQVCRGVNDVLSRVGDKWSVLIVMLLRDGARRYSDLRRNMIGVSPRMLTLTLRNLERDGMVIRSITPSIPPRVDYELSPLGHSLRVPVEALGLWAVAHQADIRIARDAFDARPPSDI